MANLRKWSTSASGNATVAGGTNTISFVEGQAPGSVNNSAREMMAQVRSIYTPDEWGWVEHSATVSVASQTVFKLAGDQTSNWTAGRRWRLKSGSSTRYGSVVSASYTSETTVTVTVDSGSLSASHSLAALAAIDSNHIPANTYVTSASLATSLGSYVTSSSLATALSPYITSNSVSAAIANYVTSNSASAMIAAQIAAASTNSWTLLGTITTTSGASQVLSSLDLTTYKEVVLVWNGVSASSGTADLGITVGGINYVIAEYPNFATSSFDGTTRITVANGALASYGYFASGGTGLSDVHAATGADGVKFRFGAVALSSATTSITVTASAGSFDAGSVEVYGVL